ncbi:MAG: glycosyltransferase family 2 protein [Anaerolineae bacterium]
MSAERLSLQTPAGLSAFVRGDIETRPVVLVYVDDVQPTLAEAVPGVVALPWGSDGCDMDALGLAPCILMPGVLPRVRAVPRHALILEHVPSAAELEGMISQARQRLAEAWEARSALAPPRLRFSVIVATFERVQQAAAAVRALCHQSFDAQAYEVVVVDNALAPEPLRQALDRVLQDVEESGPRVRLLHMPVAGVSSARNAGLAVAEGEIICTLDDDALPRVDWLEALDRAWDAAPGAMVIGGKIVLQLPTPRPTAFQAGWESLWSDLPLPYDDLIVPAADWRSYPWGANWSARRDALWRIGGFPVRYGRVGEASGRRFSKGGAHISGEEIAAAAAIVASGTSDEGQSVLLCPSAVVDHYPARERYSMAHVRHTLAASALLEHRLYRDGLIASETPWMGTARQMLGATATMLLAVLTARRCVARDRWLRLLALGEKLLVQLGLWADAQPSLDRG